MMDPESDSDPDADPEPDPHPGSRVRIIMHPNFCMGSFYGMLNYCKVKTKVRGGVFSI